jgi:hypothetical protein
MKKRRKHPVFWIGVVSLLLLLLFTGVMDLRVRSQQHQYILDRRLIAALVKNDDQGALWLINQGADPNTTYTPLPAPSLKQLLNCLFHHSTLPVNDSPTALRIVCGECCIGKGTQPFIHRPDASDLTQTMLQHGAEGNAKGIGGWTALHYAVINRRPNTVAVLLKHGVDVNARTNGSATPLYLAVLNNKNNKSADIILKLLAYGANPSLSVKNGVTVLQMAKNQRPELVNLLQQAGAKK